MNRLLKDFADELKRQKLTVSVNIDDAKECVIENITYDSKAVTDNTLFVCKGASFKKEYLEDAIKKGAVCYVSEADYNIPGFPHIIVSDIRSAMPFIARMHYQIPNDFCCIGITGTKGKTTTAYYMKAVFDREMQQKGRPEVGFMTTVETYDGQERISSGITTPESFEIYRHFNNACKSNIKHMIMEFSSQALKYKRVEGVKLEYGIFLNISEDHISPIEHPDFDDYFKSKLKIFSQCKTAVICTDSPYAEEIAKVAKKAERVITFGFDKTADIRAYDIKSNGKTTDFSAEVFGESYRLTLNMRGDFNVENALAVIAVAYDAGISMDTISSAFREVSVPGRVEEYESKDKKINVIVDYAHNGFSFRSIIGTAKKCWPGSRIITIFGCTGGKALNRRRDMGTAAGEMSDFIYLTADDPANEKIEDICAEVGSYIEKTGCRYTTIPDRETAIKTAIENVDEPSAVLILGKGCETTQKMANGIQQYPSDAVVAKKAIAKYDEKR